MNDQPPSSPQSVSDLRLGSLRAQLDAVSSRDFGRLLGRWTALKHRPDEHKVAALLAAIERSAASRRARVAAKPAIRLDASLPISARADDIIDLIRAHQVVIIAGETGSGKTTQLPKLCLAAGRGEAGMIGCTQPRRLAARSMARRVAEELGTPVGELVGFQVRFNDQVSERSLIKFMTDGILLAETQGDPWLGAYDTLIIDEAHERSLNIDFLLGYLKRLAVKRPQLKIIVTSATIDTARFSEHFDGAPVVQVEGRAYPVQVRWRPVDQARDERSDSTANRNADRYQQGSAEHIAAMLDEITHADPRGDVLVFLPGEREIRDAHLVLSRRQYRETEIMPLYARLSGGDQDRVFKPGVKRRVVLATNVAETSLTVPRIRYVVDTGNARVKRYSQRSQLERLHVEAVSQAAADQRKGRCGRVGPGICYRLYDEADFAGRAAFTDPELLRSSLANVILRMLALKLGEFDDFPFLDAPDPRVVADGYRRLAEISAIDAGRKLTPLGHTVARLPIDVQLARMLVEAQSLHCLREVLIVVSFLSVQDPRERPADARPQADAAHKLFADPASDFVGVLNLWREYRATHEALTQSKLRDWCSRHFLSFMRMREWSELHRQLLLVVAELTWTLDPASPAPAAPATSASRLLQATPPFPPSQARTSTPARGPTPPSQAPNSASQPGPTPSSPTSTTNSSRGTTPTSQASTSNSSRGPTPTSQASTSNSSRGTTPTSQASTATSSRGPTPSSQATTSTSSRGPTPSSQASAATSSRAPTFSSQARASTSSRPLAPSSPASPPTSARPLVPSSSASAPTSSRGQTPSPPSPAMGERAGVRGRSPSRSTSKAQLSGNRATRSAPVAKDSRSFASEAPAIDEKAATRLYEALHRSLLAGLPTQVGRKDDKGVYQGPRERKFHVFPGSALSKSPPNWIYSAQILDVGGRVWGMTNARVDPLWIEQQAAHLLRTSCRDPHWSKKRGAVVAFEQVSLFGLVLAEKRPVLFQQQDPALAHAIFLREALVRGELDSRADGGSASTASPSRAGAAIDFVRANQRVLAQAEELEAKQRREGLIRHEDDLVAFFAGKLPEDIASVRALDAWYRKAAPAEQAALRWSLDDVLGGDAALDAKAFPAMLEIAVPAINGRVHRPQDTPDRPQRYRLEYRFMPGDEADGVTLHLPLAMLNALPPWRCEWLVPGLLEDKVAALIRGLPKTLRRNFVPAPDFARAFAAAESPRDEALTKTLAAFLQRTTGVLISAAEFALVELPAHLRMRYLLYDEAAPVQSQTLGASRDLAELRGQWQGQARAAFTRKTDVDLAREHVATWDFAEIPLQVRTTGGLPAFPALVDMGETVALRVFERADEAHAAHVAGVVRLLRNALAADFKPAQRRLPIGNALALQYAPLGKVDSLRSDLLEGGFTDLLARHELNVRTGEAFETLRAQSQRELFAAGVERLKLAEPIIAAQAELKPWLRPPRPGFAHASHDDMHEQWDALLAPDFLRALPPERLAHFPRYLKALRLRAERLRQDPAKDQQRMLQVMPYWRAYLQQRAAGADAAALDELRWLIEEWRVSLFAQELKTAEPVSAKRLAKALAALG